MPAFDGARGLAALMVLGSHLSNAGMHALPINLSGVGKYGVYLFFALSAFLLTDQILRLPREALFSTDTWRRYALRRLLRIYPLFACFVLLSYLTTPLGGPLYAMSGEAALQHLLFQRGDSVLWSIPVEMAYYLVLPLVAIFLRVSRSVVRAAVTILAAVAVATMYWPVAGWPENSIHLGYYLPVFLAGSLAAFVNMRCGASPLFRPLAWVPLGIIVLVTPSIYSALVTPVPPTAFSGSFLLFALVWGVFLLAVARGDGTVTRILRSGVLRFVGRISFSLYLLHEPVIRAIATLPALAPASQAVAVTAASLGFAYIAFLVVERPAIRALR